MHKTKAIKQSAEAKKVRYILDAIIIWDLKQKLLC